MKKLNKKYEGWDSTQHLNEFDLWNNLSSYEFRYRWGSFLENKILIKELKSKNYSLLEVGCATGTTVKWLKLNRIFKKDKYLGIDLSGPAINKAKYLYKDATFKKVDIDFLKNLKYKYDYVFSRDTLMHQENPFKFLEELLAVSQKGLILRTRTKDKGKTEFDVNKSCQMHYDNYWMPYIVINLNEIIDFLRKFKFIKTVTINRSYGVLGGHNFRYLPKDLFIKATGGAETTIHIEIDREKTINDFEINYTNILEGHSFLNVKTFKKYVFAIARKLKVI